MADTPKVPGQEFLGGQESLALALALQERVPGAKLCIVEHREGIGTSATGAGLLISLDDDYVVWIDASGMRGLEPSSRSVVVVREAGRDELERCMGVPDVDVMERAATFAETMPELVNLPGQVAHALALDAAAVSDPRWSQPHPDAPPGNLNGWWPMMQMAADALDIIGHDLDDEWMERLDAMSPPEQVRMLYTHSDCDDFDTALHRVTGWPMIRIVFPDEDAGMGHHTVDISVTAVSVP